MEYEWVTISFSEGVLRIVHTDGLEKALIPRLSVSAARQRGQPLPGVLDLGQSVGSRLLQPAGFYAGCAMSASSGFSAANVNPK
jgi:hypothetical protein